MRHAIAQSAYLPRALHVVWAGAGSLNLVWAALLVIQGLLPAAGLFLIRLLVNSLVAAIDSAGAWENVRSTIIVAALTATALLLSEVVSSVGIWVGAARSELIQDHIRALIHAKSAAMDMAFYESPEYHDRLDRARTDASTRPLALTDSLGSLVQNGISLLAIGAILVPYGAWLPILLFTSTLPAFFVVLYFNRHSHHWWEQRTAERRWTQYYDTMLTHATAAPEVRLFDLGDQFHAGYQGVRRRLRAERLHLIRDQSLARIGATVTTILFFGLAMGWVIWRAVQGLATLGDIALFFQAFNQGSNSVRSLLRSVGDIYSDTLYLSNLFEFLDLAPQIVDPCPPYPVPAVVQGNIQFRQVTFRYPGSERVVLHDFNLTIPAGRIVAIVGANGAGKSTLLKLLCRFYDPESGCLELDGIDIRHWPVKTVRRLITVIFQQPVNYSATAAQNIAFGDLAAEFDPAEIEAAARSAGAHEFITHLPLGYNTLLGKWFASGDELSGGEWQRLALARAFVRKAPIMILDEPTSFMDSWAETDWFDRFRLLVQGRTAVVITHRFTVARRADTIHVMDEGRIVESGTHSELLALNGLYAQSWTAQMQATPTALNLEMANSGLVFHSAMNASTVAVSTSGQNRTDGN